MAFPVSPVDGQQFTTNNLTYQYNAATNSWGRIVAAVFNKSTSNSSPPASPNIGDLWYNTTNDVTYRWTFDGSNYYWVDFSGAATGISYTSSDVLNPFLLMGA